MTEARRRQAEVLFQKVADLPEHETWLIAEVGSALGRCLTVTRHFDEAETLLLKGYDAIHAAKGDGYIETSSPRRRSQ